MNPQAPVIEQPECEALLTDAAEATKPTDAMEGEPLLVDAAGAAKMLGISRSHFYNLRELGRIGPTGIKLGGKSVRYSTAELREWCRASCPPRDRWLTGKGGRA